MRDLSLQEVDSVNGGNVLAGIAWGIVGSYTYDAIGGYSGINSYASQVGAGIADGSAYKATFGAYSSFS